MKRELDQKGIRTQLRTDPKAACVTGIRDHLHQVILNLVINAMQATPEQGSIDIEVFPAVASSGQQTCIRVTDSGHGIPDEYVERIFDPFFTTKDPDKGTGLGLMIAHEIVADHGGDIEVSSPGQEGSQFLIRLPA